jgi:hypothetical protein
VRRGESVGGAAGLEKIVPFQEGCGPYLLGGKPTTPSSISNTGLIDGVLLSTLMGFTTFVTHYDFYTVMDQIHLSPLVDQIQLTLEHISHIYIQSSIHV